ncbi:hypothetical protein [Neobacillus sp. YIM B06451]|uniref:hypothetical protein n=1 Tax=Neobacillus sp. YIM B06451 TaxID=3070994 RepID=UPI00292D5128|nr:hypothetical protein [Neobacillus sp. YIM B06451]
MEKGRVYFLPLMIIFIFLLVGCSDNSAGKKEQSNNLIAYSKDGEKLFELASNPVLENGKYFYYWTFYQPIDVKGGLVSFTLKCLDCKNGSFTHGYYNFPQYHPDKISENKPFKLKGTGPQLFNGKNRIRVYAENFSKDLYGELIVESSGESIKPEDEGEYYLEEGGSAVLEEQSTVGEELEVHNDEREIEIAKDRVKPLVCKEADDDGVWTTLLFTVNNTSYYYFIDARSQGTYAGMYGCSNNQVAYTLINPYKDDENNLNKGLFLQNIFYKDNWIYFSNSFGNHSAIWKMAPDGSEVYNLKSFDNGASIEITKIENGTIYYVVNEKDAGEISVE